MRLIAFAFACCVTAAAMAEKTALDAATQLAKQPPKLTLEATAPQVLAACRDMLPKRPVKLSGALILRNRKGIVQKECDYRFVMRRSLEQTLLTIRLFERHTTNEIASVTVLRRGDEKPTISLTANGKTQEVGSPLDCVMDTDVTWLDLSLDYLWWTNPRYEAEREGESVHGQKCSVILVDPPDAAAASGIKAVRLWADKKNGCLMQAETLDANSRPVRRLWGTRVKKFGERWMANVLETETLGSGRRTKITVEELKELP